MDKLLLAAINESGMLYSAHITSITYPSSSTAPQCLMHVNFHYHAGRPHLPRGVSIIAAIDGTVLNLPDRYI